MKKSKAIEAAKEIEALAYMFVEGMAARADAKFPYPMWHGWALREAFRAGYDAAKEEQKRAK